jgi:hypothetical protein
MRSHHKPLSIRVLGLLALVAYVGSVAVPILWRLEFFTSELMQVILMVAGCLLTGAMLHGFASLVSVLYRLVRAIEQGALTSEKKLQESEEGATVFTDKTISDEEAFEGLYKSRSELP